MKRLLAGVLVLTGCGGVVCGPGTEEVSGVCVPTAPPHVEVAPLPALPDFVEPPRPSELALHVVVAADGSVTVDGEPLADEALDARARAYLAQHPADGSAIVEAPSGAPHAAVMALIDRLVLVGLTHVSIRTTPPTVP